MRPSFIKSNYQDNLTRKRRAVFVFKSILIILLALVVMASTIYFLFFSKVLEVQSIVFEGITPLNSERLKQDIEANLNQKYLGYLLKKNNIFSFKLGGIEKNIMDKYPIFNSLSIKRDVPHTLIINVTERTPIGIWCFEKLSECYYFDENKNMWPSQAKSSGFLMVSVLDKVNGNNTIDDEYFKATKIIIENSKKRGIIFESIETEHSFRALKVTTSEPYYILFSLDSDIQNQLDLLSIFLDQKKDQDFFSPQYLDLRIDGRVYYK